MADKKLRSKFLEDIQTKYNIVLSMKELTSASEVRGHVDWRPVIGQGGCLPFFSVRFKEIEILNDDCREEGMSN